MLHEYFTHCEKVSLIVQKKKMIQSEGWQLVETFYNSRVITYEFHIFLNDPVLIPKSKSKYN